MNVETKVVGSTSLLAAAAAVATAAAPTGAMAADLALKAPGPVAAPSWQGLYVGGSVGASWLNSVLDDGAANAFGYSGSGSRQTANSIGVIGGLDVGYNWQDRNFVYGVEADFSWIGSSKASATGGITGYTGYTGTKTSRVQGLATFRGRFGFDIDGTMPYLTAGLAVADIKNSYSVVGYGGAGPGFSASKTSWQPGVALGGGIEHQFGNRWSLKAEVLWVGLKDTTMSSPSVVGYGGGNVQFSNSLVIGRVGLNYRF